MGWMNCGGVNWRNQIRPVIWAGLSAFSIVGADIWLNGNAGEPTATRLLVAIAPALPTAVCVWEQMRSISKLDELQRRIHYEGLAIAFGVATVMMVLYGSLRAGRFVPSVSWETVWFGVVALWTVSYVIAALRYR